MTDNPRAGDYSIDTPTTYGGLTAEQLRIDAMAYRKSIEAPNTADMFTLAHQWRDKKHRHVFDLCKKLDEAADHIDRLQRMIDEAQISNSNPPERQMPLTDGEMVHPRPAS